MINLRGTGVALVTPFNEDFSIDFESLEKLVQLQLDGNIDYLVVQGSTGESATLNNDEKLAVLETVKKVNNGKLPIVYGVGGNNTAEILEKIKNVPAGVDAILSVSPAYNKPSQEGIYQHYLSLSQHSKLPVILYNVPGRTGSNMSAKTVLRLAELPNIVAVKEASGDFMQIMEIIKDKPEGFEVISGDDAITLPMIAAGAIGVISVVGQAYPEFFTEIAKWALRNKYKEARQYHYELLEITKMMFEEGNPAGVKAALTKRGIIKNYLRMPLLPVSDDLFNRISKETDRLLKH